MPISKYALKRRAATLLHDVLSLGLDNRDGLNAWFERFCVENDVPPDALSRRAAEVAFLQDVYDRRRRTRDAQKAR